MAKKPVTESVLYLDTENELFHIYTMTDGAWDSLSCYLGNYKAKPFSADFYLKLGETLDSFRESHPDVPLQKLSVVLPDSVIITDTLNVPTIGKRAMSRSVNVVLSNIFKNSKELTFNHTLAAQNPQFSTYSVVGTQKSVLARLHKTLSEHQVGISNITYASSCAASCVCSVIPKLKSASFVILDMKEKFTRMVFVAKGRAIAFLRIPFGSDILNDAQVIPEEQLLDHSAAELIVLNAREKARSKAITLLDKPLDEYPDEDSEESSDIASKTSGAFLKHSKSARRLPAHLIRPMPETKEGFIYENFRSILKWALGAISSNVPTCALGSPDSIYLNMPEKYSFLYPILADESEECGIKIQQLFSETLPESIKTNPEVFGGFFYAQMNKGNNFTLSAFPEFAVDSEAEASTKKS